MPFFFVSAADGTNVVQMFEHAIKAAWAHKKDPVSEHRCSVVLRLKHCVPDDSTPVSTDT